jgi:hypothetical protein
MQYLTQYANHNKEATMSWREKLPQPDKLVTITARVKPDVRAALDSCCESMSYTGRGKRAQLAGDILEEAIVDVKLLLDARVSSEENQEPDE